MRVPIRQQKAGEFRISAWLAPIWLTCAGWGLTEDVTSAPGTNAPPTMPEPYAAVVALPKGYDTGGEYLRWAKQEAENLAREARQATEAPPRADRLLLAANVLLSNGFEVPATTLLLGLPRDPSIGDESSLMELLEVAEKLLDEAEADGGSAIEEEGDARRGQRETLRAFSQTLRAVFGRDNGGSDEAIREARSALSRLREHDEPQVSAAASLWQAILRSRETDSAPVLSILDGPSVELKAATLPHAFFGRLLRCRIIAQRGGAPTALAMLSQLEERCRDWFDDEAERDRAIRTCTAVEMGVLAEWGNRLDAAGDSDAKSWCDERMTRLWSDRFHKDRDVLRLAPAVPMVVQRPHDAAARERSPEQR
ncbi:MAG: hypothetical protein AABZ12_13970 [Planctomycetota bacterium]